LAKVALTLWDWLMVTVQAPVPLHAPLQPVKAAPEAAVAVRVTVAPLGKLVLHVLPQAIPLGEEATMPLPLPAFVTVRMEVVVVFVANVAVRLLAASTTRAQPPVPVHAPLQPVKVAPEAGVALRAMLVPLA
jgi:hypothetical protein